MKSRGLVGGGRHELRRCHENEWTLASMEVEVAADLDPAGARVIPGRRRCDGPHWITWSLECGLR